VPSACVNDTCTSLVLDGRPCLRAHSTCIFLQHEGTQH
jgi:hypothetical protein